MASTAPRALCLHAVSQGDTQVGRRHCPSLFPSDSAGSAAHARGAARRAGGAVANGAGRRLYCAIEEGPTEADAVLGDADDCSTPRGTSGPAGVCSFRRARRTSMSVYLAPQYSMSSLLCDLPMGKKRLYMTEGMNHVMLHYSRKEAEPAERWIPYWDFKREIISRSEAEHTDKLYSRKEAEPADQWIQRAVIIYRRAS